MVCALQPKAIEHLCGRGCLSCLSLFWWVFWHWVKARLLFEYALKVSGGIPGLLFFHMPDDAPCPFRFRGDVVPQQHRKQTEAHGWCFVSVSVLFLIKTAAKLRFACFLHHVSLCLRRPKHGLSHKKHSFHGKVNFPYSCFL